MLLVIVVLYFSVTNPESGAHTFNMLHMMDPANYVPGSFFSALANQALFGIPARLLGFIVLFVAFAIKVPIVPLHTWLPDAHVEAHTPISIRSKARRVGKEWVSTCSSRWRPYQ